MQNLNHLFLYKKLLFTFPEYVPLNIKDENAWEVDARSTVPVFVNVSPVPLKKIKVRFFGNIL